MRFLAAALALLVAAPAAAQEPPAWVGVWEGRVGTYPVRLCIDVWGDGPARGSYYYLSQLEPIALSEEDGEGGWIERAPGGEAEALWEFAEQTGARLRGTWRQGARSLPFTLTPMQWTEGEWSGPCSSTAFLAPRIGGGRVETADDELEGWAFMRQTYRPAAHFRDEVMVESFIFAPEQGGDPAINSVLVAAMPDESVRDEFVQCLAGAIASLGTDGYFERSLRPAMVSEAFLAIVENTGNFCGGAHPYYGTAIRTFDRQTGEELDLFDWLGEARIDGEDSTLSEALRAEVMARWPGDDAECREIAGETAYWLLGLAREGLVFRPDLPHVAMACSEPVTVEWDALAAFLDAEGRAGLARLRGP